MNPNSEEVTLRMMIESLELRMQHAKVLSEKMKMLTDHLIAENEKLRKEIKMLKEGK